ncbi:MAG TPA: hypothetical protein DEA08_14090, partial [Planctomycetes bacterium]|nr:hypothetical protein [Planctomycetota bacterium]
MRASRKTRAAIAVTLAIAGALGVALLGAWRCRDVEERVEVSLPTGEVRYSSRTSLWGHRLWEEASVEALSPAAFLREERLLRTPDWIHVASTWKPRFRCGRGYGGQLLDLCGEKDWTAWSRAHQERSRVLWKHVLDRLEQPGVQEARRIEEAARIWRWGSLVIGQAEPEIPLQELEEWL